MLMESDDDEDAERQQDLLEMALTKQKAPTAEPPRATKLLHIIVIIAPSSSSCGQFRVHDHVVFCFLVDVVVPRPAQCPWGSAAKETPKEGAE